MKIFDPKLTGSIEIQNTITGNVSIAGDLTVEGNLNSTFDSSTGTAISGAFTQDSSSFATRIDDLETFEANIDSTYATDAQLATAVSGLNASTSSYLQNTTDTLTGDLTVTGTITAQEFHTEFVSASIIYESGSTQFGNSSDDIHRFTGSIATSDPIVITGDSSSDLTETLKISNAAGDRLWNLQLSDTNNLALWSYNGSSWTYRAAFVNSGGFNSQDYIEAVGFLYTRSNLKVINSTSDGWNTWGTYSNGWYNLTANSLTTPDSLIYIGGGSVGIGTNSPSHLLTVNSGSSGRVNLANFGNGTNAGGTEAAIKLTNATNSGACDVNLVAYRSGANFGSDFYIELSDGVDGTDRNRFHIRENGNVGIGTSTASDLLHLRNTGVDNPSLFLLEGAQLNRGLQISLTTDSNGAVGAAAVYNARTAGGYGGHIFQNGGSTKMLINANGNVGIGNTSPDSLLQIGESFQTTSGTNKKILANMGGYYSTVSGRQYQVLGFTGTTFDESDIFSQNSGEVVKNFYIGLVSDAGYFNANRFSVVGGGSEIMTFKSDTFNVGVGTSAPDARLDVTGNSTGLVAALKLANTHGSGGSQGQVGMEFSVKNSISVEARSTITSEERTADSNLTNLIFSVSDNNSGNPAEAFRLTGGGSAGDPTYLRMASGTGGIQFGGDTAAANALDDYEEGTWTPIFYFDIGNPTISYVNQEGYYQKIGNTVTVWFDLYATGMNSTSYYWARLSGLPFGMAGNNQYIKAPIHHSGNSNFSVALRGGTNPVFYYTLGRTDFARGNNVDSAYITGHFSYQIA